MRTFRDLIISGGSHDQRKFFLKEVSESLPKDWVLKKELIEGYIKNTSKNSDEIICVESPQINGKTGLVWFGLQRDDTIKVYNILPQNVGSLSHDEYNAILEGFLDSCVSNIKNKFNFKIEISSNEFFIESIAGDKTSELLKRWESNCNRTTGNSHPLDFERWADFIYEAHKSKSKLTPEILGRWLLEVKGWFDYDLVYKLTSDYEYALDIIESYDNHK